MRYWLISPRMAPSATAHSQLEWSESDGVQTGGSHFLYEHSPLDVRAVKQARQERFARSRRKDSAFAAVRQAAHDLAAAGETIFNPAMVQNRVRELGFDYMPTTLKLALRAEALAEHGELAALRPGLYRLRTANISAAASAAATEQAGRTRATEPVRVALRELLPEGQRGAATRRTAVEAYLA